MNKQELVDAIEKKLKDKFGYNKKQIRLYWEVNKKYYHNDFSIDWLEKELEEI